MRQPLVIYLGCVALVLSLLKAGADSGAFAVLERNCVECHNAHDRKGDVVLDRGPLVIEDPTLILEAVSGKRPDMPPKRDPLSSQDIAALRQWVASGAKIPAGRVLQDTRIADRQWWSLKPLRKPEVLKDGDGWRGTRSTTSWQRSFARRD